MYLISDPSKDHRHPKTSSGAYEWWYFDVLDEETGIGVVIIFYDGLLFSPDYHIAQQKSGGEIPNKFPGISISVYEKGKTLFYALKGYSKDRAFFSDTHCEVMIGNNSVTVDVSHQYLTYCIQLDEQLPNKLHLHGSLTFQSNNNPPKWIAGESSDDHLWNLIQAKNNVSANLQLARSEKILNQITFSGSGYHDHNMGNRPIDDDFDQWYWGRIHLDGSTLVWYIMFKDDEMHQGAWVIKDKDGRVSPVDSIRLKTPAKTNIFGLSFVDKIEVGVDGLLYDIRTDYIWDQGPFYLRYKVRLTDTSGTQKKGSKAGIAEFIKPNRISKKWVRPMIRVRYHHDESQAHWIQKSLRLSKWTW